MSNTWTQLKEIKGLLAGLVTAFTVVSVIGLALMDWRVSVHVAKALASQDLGTDAKIVSMDDEIDANGAKAMANTTRIDGNERRVEQAFAALMGRPIPDRRAMTEFTLWLVDQTIIIVLAILGAYVRMAVNVARVEVNTETLKGDHANLTKQVQGISRSVGRLEGRVNK